VQQKGALASAVVATSALMMCGFGLLGSRTVTAQADDAWSPAYPMRLTAERALAFVDASNRKLDYVPGEVLVKFRSGTGPLDAARALSVLRSRPALSALRWIGSVAVVTDRTEPDATMLAAELQAQPEVDAAEPNFIYHTSKVPNDPGFTQRQWNMDAIDMPGAWDLNPGATDKIVVAVVDTGITSVSHSYSFKTWNGRTTQTAIIPFGMNPDLTANRIVAARDLVFWDGPVLDMEGHGTHVASTIGENTDNDLAEAGIAYHAKIMPVKVCVGYWDVQFTLSASGYQGFVPADIGGCPLSEVADGIRYAADNGAHVINLSLGGPQPSSAIHDALTYAVGKGAFVSIAMGNEHDAGNPTEYPAAYAADIDGVMSVGALGPSLTRSYYSNTGPHLEISAPGGNDREGAAAGVIWQTTIRPDDAMPDITAPRFDRYVEAGLEGTSMAAPHVAGVAALLFSHGVNKPAAVEALIKKTARHLGPPDGTGPDRNQEYGYGLVQPRTALRGFGVAR
jgi:serine protease